MAVAVELGEVLYDDCSCRHVDTECEGFGCEDQLDQPLHKAGLYCLLEGGHHAGVVSGNASLESVRKTVEAEDIEVSSREMSHMVFGNCPDL